MSAVGNKSGEVLATKQKAQDNVKDDINRNISKDCRFKNLNIAGKFSRPREKRCNTDPSFGDVPSEPIQIPKGSICRTRTNSRCRKSLVEDWASDGPSMAIKEVERIRVDRVVDDVFQVVLDDLDITMNSDDDTDDDAYVASNQDDEEDEDHDDEEDDSSEFIPPHELIDRGCFSLGMQHHFRQKPILI